MVNYEEKSNTEINIAVAIALGYEYIGRGYIDDADGVYRVITKEGRRMSLPNYCKDPMEAWPIILENKISMCLDDGESFAYHQPYYDDITGAVSDYQYEYSDINILRAAMIVFLMMKEAENEVT